MADGAPETIVERLIDDEKQIRGLARITADAMSLQMEDAEADLSLLAETSEILAPEINFLEFAYISETETLDAWDTATNGLLPQAIQITFGFRASEDEQQSDRGITEETVNTVEHIVTVPLAVPYNAELSESYLAVSNDRSMK